MAIKLSEVNGVSNSTNLKYVADEESEKNDIPAEDKIQGTEVLVIESGKTYKMNSNGEWILKSGSGGGSGSGLPAVTVADNGDVLTVVNGAWDKAAPSGGNENAAWSAMMKHMVFADPEPVSNRALDIYVLCSDGLLQGSWQIESDAETGDWRYSFGEWINDPEYPVPNYENYTATLEYNLGLILEAAFSKTHDVDRMYCQTPIIVCRKYPIIYPWDLDR